MFLMRLDCLVCDYAMSASNYECDRFACFRFLIRHRRRVPNAVVSRLVHGHSRIGLPSAVPSKLGTNGSSVIVNGRRLGHAWGMDQRTTAVKNGLSRIPHACDLRGDAGCQRVPSDGCFLTRKSSPKLRHGRCGLPRSSRSPTAALPWAAVADDSTSVAHAECSWMCPNRCNPAENRMDRRFEPPRPAAVLPI